MKALVIWLWKEQSLILLLITLTYCKAENCTSLLHFGNKPTSSLSNFTTPHPSNRSLLLNRRDSAPCSGSLNAWSFCYSVDIFKEPHNISVGVWRLTDTNDTYDLVKGSLISLPQSDAYRRFEFVCLTLNVDPVSVRVGDVVGAIVPAAPTAFNLVGVSADDGSQELASLPLPGVNSHVSFPEGDLSQLPGYGLYLEGLGVTSAPATAVPTTSAATTSTTTTTTTPTTLTTSTTQNVAGLQSRGHQTQQQVASYLSSEEEQAIGLLQTPAAHQQHADSAPDGPA